MHWGAGVLFFFFVIFFALSSLFRHVAGRVPQGGAFASLLGAELSGLSGSSALCAAVPCGVPPSRESTRRMDAWMCPCGTPRFGRLVVPGGA